MRHRKSGRQLNRNSSHRQAMFRNMAGSLVRHEIIKTTLPKAKELRRVVEPLITLAKTDSVANRRLAFARTRDNEIVAKLFNELGPLLTLTTPNLLEILSSTLAALFCSRLRSRNSPSRCLSSGTKAMPLAIASRGLRIAAG